MTRSAWVPASLAARKLGVQVRTVRGWIARRVLRGHSLRCYRDGRRRWFVLRRDLDAWIDGRDL